MKLKSEYKTIIIIILALAIIFRIILIFINPISMFADAIMRYVPQSQQILNLSFNFHDLPLFVLILSFWRLVFSGQMLHMMWKITSFIFFIAILLLLPRLFRRFKLNNLERIIVMALFFFSTWSLLLSTTIMQEMMLVFFTIALFLVVERYFEKQDKKIISLAVLLTFLMCLTKITSYLILFGFGLYILIKNKKDFLKKKINLILSLIMGVVLTIFWPIKNYILFGRPFVPVELNSVILHSFSEYLHFFILTYHYFWEFPLLEKVNFTGILAIFFNIYYVSTIVITAAFSVLLIISLIKYCKKHKEFIGLLAPLFLFALIYWPFIILWSESDSGRYTFPFWIFLFIFVSKYISLIKKENIKKICHIIIVLFCIVSIISAFGISSQMRSIDNQIRDMEEVLKQENLENAIFISNTEVGAVSLFYYSGMPIQFNLSKNIVDSNVKCEGNKIFESKDFDIFKEGNEYRICKR